MVARGRENKEEFCYFSPTISALYVQRVAVNADDSAAMTESAAMKADPLPEGLLEFKALEGMDLFWTRCKLAFALPWRRFKKDSVLVFKLEGEITDQGRGRFDPGLSVPQVSHESMSSHG